MSPIIIFRVSAAQNHNGTQREVLSGTQLRADIDGASAPLRSRRQKRHFWTKTDGKVLQSPDGESTFSDLFLNFQ